jgi:hypothetical protein
VYSIIVLEASGIGCWNDRNYIGFMNWPIQQKTPGMADTVRSSIYTHADERVHQSTWKSVRRRKVCNTTTNVARDDVSVTRDKLLYLYGKQDWQGSFRPGADSRSILPVSIVYYSRPNNPNVGKMLNSRDICCLERYRCAR